MTSFSLRAPWVGALLAGGAMAFAPHSVTAQDCSTASDCSEGYRCERYTYESCNGWACEAGDPRCPDPVPEPVCYEDEYTSCVPAPCASDSECPDRMVCHAQRYYVCDGSMGFPAGAGGAAAPCAPGEMCAPPETCWEEAGDSLCTPRYQLPCTVASDCGGGFDCIENKYWVCSGGGMAGAGTAGTGAAGSGAAADAGMPLPPDQPVPMLPPDDYECHEESSGTFYCQLQDLPCSADADCPDGLECKDNYYYPPCVGEAGRGAGGDGMEGDFTCPEPSIQKRCMPPEYYGGIGSPVPGVPPGMMGSGGASAPGGGPVDGGVSDPTAPMGSAGSASGSAGTGAGGSSGGSAPGGDGDEMEAPSTDNGTANGSDDDANGGDGDAEGGGGGSFGWLTGGCSASGPISADPLSWLAFGLVALVMRRRSRSAA